MFNPIEFINSLCVDSDDEELTQVTDLIKLKHLIYNDGWTVRQSCYNEAFGMLSHLKYLGGTLLPKAEQRINQLDNRTGILGETDISVGWGKKYTNEDRPHINDETPVDQQVDNQKTFVDDLKTRMRTVAISFVCHQQEHDDISMDLNQLSFSAIQARSAQKRAATG
jgi:hypothetical protein